MGSHLTHATGDRSAWAHHVATQTLRPSPDLRVHDFMAMAYLTAGSAVMSQETGGQRELVEVGAGDVYLVPAGRRHGMVSANAPAAWGIGLHPTCYAETSWAPLLAPFARAAAGGAKVIRIPEARRSYFSDLCAELGGETAAASGRAAAPNHLVQSSLVALILAEVARAPERHTLTLTATATATATQGGMVGEALRFIECHCLGPLSLGDVAAAVHRSPSHVSTTVRRATGKSVMQWIITGRLAAARARLLATDEAIDVIAGDVGYADPTHFIRLFRREHGVTPAAWRRARPSARS